MDHLAMPRLEFVPWVGGQILVSFQRPTLLHLEPEMKEFGLVMFGIDYVPSQRLVVASSLEDYLSTLRDPLKLSFERLVDEIAHDFSQQLQPQTVTIVGNTEHPIRKIVRASYQGHTQTVVVPMTPTAEAH